MAGRTKTRNLFYEKYSELLITLRKLSINSLFLKLSKTYKRPKTELNYINNFTFLVAVVLSAQSTDVSVNKTTSKLFKLVKQPKDIIKLGEYKLRQIIKTIGLYNSKSKNIISLSKILIDKYNSKIPKDFNELLTLPGVGKKTASVYQNVILNKPKIAVDTHVFRVSNRIGLVTEKTTDKTQEALEKIVPIKWKKTAHHLLILHGRKICKARKPLCRSCIIFSFCKYQKKI